MLTTTVTPILLLALVGATGWFVFAESYEQLLGNIAWDLFPQKEIFLSLNNHVFSIGLRSQGDVIIPHLTLIGHNFGFGLVVTGAVILGKRGNSWPLRFLGLGCVWIFLLITQIVLIVLAAHTYLFAVTQPNIPWGFRAFVNSVHPTVTLLPVAIVVIWIVIPFEKYYRVLRDGWQREFAHNRPRHRKRKKQRK